MKYDADDHRWVLAIMHVAKGLLRRRRMDREEFWFYMRWARCISEKELH